MHPVDTAVTDPGMHIGKRLQIFERDATQGEKMKSQIGTQHPIQMLKKSNAPLDIVNVSVCPFK